MDNELLKRDISKTELQLLQIILAVLKKEGIIEYSTIESMVGSVIFAIMDKMHTGLSSLHLTLHLKNDLVLD
ncbi:hypothetical protein MXB_1690 [Myxobolus squamalis]|nr:hypothetical protein MXB_1690 [Myxobolus squamalis]